MFSKEITVVVLLLTVCAFASGQRFRSCIPPTVPNSRCPVVERDSFLPHETDCESYYKCYNGCVTQYKCPDGLHFNMAILRCDWYFNANCDTSKTTTSSSKETESTVSVGDPSVPTGKMYYI